MGIRRDNVSPTREYKHRSNSCVSLKSARDAADATRRAEMLVSGSSQFMITKVRRIPSQSITQSRLIIPYTTNSQYLVISSTPDAYVRDRVGGGDCGLRHFRGPCSRASVSLELTSLITTLFPGVALGVGQHCHSDVSSTLRRENTCPRGVTLTRRFCAIREIGVAIESGSRN